MQSMPSDGETLMAGRVRCWYLTSQKSRHQHRFVSIPMQGVQMFHSEIMEGEEE